MTTKQVSEMMVAAINKSRETSYQGEGLRMFIARQLAEGMEKVSSSFKANKFLSECGDSWAGSTDRYRPLRTHKRRIAPYDISTLTQVIETPVPPPPPTLNPVMTSASESFDDGEQEYNELVAVAHEMNAAAQLAAHVLNTPVVQTQPTAS